MKRKETNREKSTKKTRGGRKRATFVTFRGSTVQKEPMSKRGMVFKRKLEGGKLRKNEKKLGTLNPFKKRASKGFHWSAN